MKVNNGFEIILFNLINFSEFLKYLVGLKQL